MTPDDLAARLAAVRSRVDTAARRSGRDGGAVTILAVTKGHPATAVEAAAAAGLLDIGESRVQEARAKRVAVGDAGLPRSPGLRWHLVGHLQQNKAKVAATVFDCVHSIDSVRIGAALAGHRDGAEPLRAFLEVELTGLPGRTGATPAEADELVAALQEHRQLLLVGLMTIAPPGDGDGARTCFAGLRELRDALHSRHGVALRELSMGMSDDFEVAVAEGATIVRLGRVLFGEPPGQQRDRRGPRLS